MTDDFAPETARDHDRLIYAGLLGLGVASILQLFEREEPDLPQLVGVYCQAFAIPLLTTSLITAYARKTGTVVPVWRDFIGLLGALAAVIGFGSMLFHYGYGPGIIFTVGSLFGAFLIRRL